ncbi:MAG: vanadium-dependent haloperoxidase [Bacteroidota bacterium]
MGFGTFVKSVNCPSIKRLTDVIVHDIFSPPQASRIYAYPSIAAYEALRHDYPEYATMEGQLTDFTKVPKPKSDSTYCFSVASTHAFLKVGKALIFSEDKIESFEAEMHEKFAALQMPQDVYKRSLAYGEAVADHVLAWADKDNYKQTRTFPKYSITEDPAKWKPTPPGYMDGIEPHWRELRPFVIKSADQFTPPPPTAFDMDKNSLFYKELMEVYEALDADHEERKAIASFWDCNPYVMNVTGHVMYATKKITPGGHWIGIVKIAAEKAGSNIMESAEAYAMTSIALADAFISCWDEKYRSNLIRPETVINQYVDEDWRPALQTPPFPEYTSGHSVISRAAAITLTKLYGDNFAFDDDTEEEYGLPTRSYKSFLEASEEAAVSRLYGGIHYRPAIDNGVAQGEEVGKYIVANLKTRPTSIGSRE